MRDLCESANRGKVCCDDLCRSNPDNTLCGFSQEEYDEITRDFDPEDDDREWTEEDEEAMERHAESG